MTLDENGGRSQIRFTSISTYYIPVFQSELPRTFTPPVTIRRRNKTDRVKLSHFLPVRVPTALPFGRPCRYLYVAAVASCSLLSARQVAELASPGTVKLYRKEGRPTVPTGTKARSSPCTFGFFCLNQPRLALLSAFNAADPRGSPQAPSGVFRDHRSRIRQRARSRTFSAVNTIDTSRLSHRTLHTPGDSTYSST